MEGGIIWLVLDVADAYWLAPLRPAERRYQCAAWEGNISIFKRTAQGTKASSLTWSHMSAALSRLLQSPFTQGDAALDTYSVDPLLALAGSTDKHDLHACIFMCAILVLGFELSCHKGQYSRNVVWIGTQMQPTPEGILLTVSETLVTEIWAMIDAMLTRSVVPVKDLRRLAGKANFVAGIVWTWRPFLADLFFLGGGAGAP